MAKFNNVLETIGNTPLIRLSNIEKKYGLNAKIYAKVEYFNPAGSVKDRVAFAMIKDAMDKGLIHEDTTIIEPTSGNTGIGLALVAASLGLKVILTMPESMSIERRNLLRAYGAKLVLTPKELGMKGAIAKANELAKEIKHSFIPSQFENLANPNAHYTSTGREIYKDLEGQLDIFVAGIGTGGTISGVGKYLKEMNGNIRIVGIEPSSSPFLTKGTTGPHGLMGIGAGFKPNTLDSSIVDEIMLVKEEDAYAFGKEAVRSEGLLVGITSGAALYAAVELAKKEENKGKTIVALFPDSGERYLSTPMFKTKVISYPAIIEKDEQDEGWYNVNFVDIIGGRTCGSSYDNAIYMAKDLLRLYAETRPNSLGKPSDIEALKEKYKDKDIVMIDIEVDA